MRVFPPDRIVSLEAAGDVALWEDVQALTIHNFHQHQAEPDQERLMVAFSGEAARRFEHEGLAPAEDGTVRWTRQLERRDIPFFARQCLGMGPEAGVLKPLEVRDEIARLLTELGEIYRAGDGSSPAKSR